MSLQIKNQCKNNGSHRFVSTAFYMYVGWLHVDMEELYPAMYTYDVSVFCSGRAGRSGTRPQEQGRQDLRRVRRPGAGLQLRRHLVRVLQGLLPSQRAQGPGTCTAAVHW